MPTPLKATKPPDTPEAVASTPPILDSIAFAETSRLPPAEMVFDAVLEIRACISFAIVLTASEPATDAAPRLTATATPSELAFITWLSEVA